MRIQYFIRRSLFHSRLKTHLVVKSLPQTFPTTSHLDCLLGLYRTGLIVLDGFSCPRLSCLNCQYLSAR